jgi:hypothetical protein
MIEGLFASQLCFLWQGPSVIEHFHGAQILFNCRVGGLWVAG